MRKRKRTPTTATFVFVSALLAVAAVGAGVASAGKPAPTLTCTGVVGTGTWGNVVVPAGSECRLNHLAIQGSVYVGAESDLYVDGGSIAGNLFASGADDVATGISLGSTHIYGNVSIDSSEFVGFDGPIDGNASFTGNDFVQLVPPAAHIGGNASFTGNTAIQLIQLGVGGNLSCSGNGAFTLISLTVGGHASGQCD
jgi:hypothetical protein